MDPSIVFPAPKIKEEDDLSDIIDLDRNKTEEDLVYEWDSKVRTKIKNFFVVDSEQCLDTLMKWYCQLIKEEAEGFEDFPDVKDLTARHIQFFRLYFIELNCCFVDNYLDNMEQILSFYCNLQVKSFLTGKKNGNKRAYKKSVSLMSRRIISVLNLYLLHSIDRVHHVVMRIKLNSLSDESKDLMNRIYRKLVTDVIPEDKSDLGFCRIYILCQKWKTIRKSEDWDKMDEVIYKLYERTAECLKTNETLTQILLPQNNSVLDMLIHLTEKHVIITEEYFKFIKSKKSQEDSLVMPEIANIEINEQNIPDLMDNSDDGDFDKAYHNFVKTMSSLSQGSSNTIFDDTVTVKLEDDEDCQIVAVSSLGYESESTELVHEILEDDDDIEIIYFKKKEQNVAQKDREKSTKLSFLDSIEIPDPSDTRTEKVSSSCNTSTSTSRNLVTTSTNTSADSPSPRCNWSLQKSAEVLNSSFTTNFQKRTKSDKNSSSSSVTTSVANFEVDSECISSVSKTSNDMDTSAEEPSIRSSVRIKSVTNMQTQTEDCNQNSLIDNSCQNEKPPEEGDSSLSYYYYGLVTPPSDQPLDEHIPPSDSNMNPNVYAKIVRTHNSPDESDIAKTLDYLPPSVEDANLENNSEDLPHSYTINETVDLILPLEQNHNNEDSKDTTSVSPDKKFESITKNLDKLADSTDVCVNHTLNITEERIVDEIDLHQNDPDNIDKNIASQDHESDIILKNFDYEVVIENVPNTSPLCTETKISCTSSDSHTCSSNSTGFIDVPLRPCLPNNEGDIFKTPVSSEVDSCTSTDISQNYSFKSNNIPISKVESRRESCPSPDITSTSTDVQEIHENLSTQEKNQVGYENFCFDLSETEDVYVDNENQCSEEYVQYSPCNDNDGNLKNNESVICANMDDNEDHEEIFIGDTVLINCEDPSFIIEDALPVGANVNVTSDNHSNDSSIHIEGAIVINNGESNENVKSEAMKQVEEIVNGEVIPLKPVKKLKVTVEKLEGDNDGVIENKKLSGSPRKIMFTSYEKIEKSADEFSKFEETIHSRWNKLKVTHELDEILCGPVTKVNGISSCVNPDTNFDLFNLKACGENSPQIHNNSSGNSSGEVISPAYEGIDDFRTYYEENKNSDMMDLSPIQNKSPSIGNDSCNTTASLGDNGHDHKENKIKQTKSQIFVAKNLKSLQSTKINTNNSASVSINSKDRAFQTKAPANGKRMRIAFAEHVIDTSNTVSHSPTENTNDVLQSILKKSPSDGDKTRRIVKRTRPRIPRRLMDLKSLAHYNVKPNDPCIQGVPCVVIERLSDSEISQWLRVSEISRKVRLQKQQAQFASKQLTCRVDYDKQTTHINENDVLRYNTPEGVTTISVPHTLGLRHWRSNAILQSKSSRLDEGTVAIIHSLTNINDNDYSSIPGQCKNSCCSSLSADLTNLNVSRPLTGKDSNLSCSNSNPNLKCFGPCCLTPKINPFSLATDCSKKIPCRATQQPPTLGRKKHNYFDIANLSQSDNTCNSNKITDNTVNFYFKCKEASNCVMDLDQNQFNNESNLKLNEQPSIVAEVEDFEKTIITEEMGQTPSLPSDLYNLNLSKFSPSPVINCLSPPSDSPSYTFPSDSCKIEKMPSLVPENFHSNAPLYDKTVSFVNSSKDSAVKQANVVIPNIDNLISNCSPEVKSYNSGIESNVSQTTDTNIKTKDEITELLDIKSDIFTKIDVNILETESETRLPLKKRKLSIANTKEEMTDEDFIGPDLVEEIIKRARAEEIEKEDISYPAKPMISIAEIQEKLAEPHPRVFKTPAERKEMPPPPIPTYTNPSESPRIVTEQYNNQTYNNPTINYHMNNVPYHFFPCASLPYFPPILLPINSTATFDMNLVTPQPTQSTTGQEPNRRPKRDRRTRSRKKNH